MKNANSRITSKLKNKMKIEGGGGKRENPPAAEGGRKKMNKASSDKFLIPTSIFGRVSFVKLNTVSPHSK